MRVAILALAVTLVACVAGAPEPESVLVQDDRSDPFCRIATCDGTSSAGDETCEAVCGVIWTCSHLVVSIDANGVITRQQWYCSDEINR